jgi:hypothetical protein
VCSWGEASSPSLRRNPTRRIASTRLSGRLPQRRVGNKG